MLENSFGIPLSLTTIFREGKVPRASFGAGQGARTRCRTKVAPGQTWRPAKVLDKVPDKRDARAKSPPIEKT